MPERPCHECRGLGKVWVHINQIRYQFSLPVYEWKTEGRNFYGKIACPKCGGACLEPVAERAGAVARRSGTA